MKPLRGPTAFGPFQQRAAEETESATKLALRRRSVMSGTSGQEMFVVGTTVSPAGRSSTGNESSARASEALFLVLVFLLGSLAPSGGLRLHN